MCFLNLGEAEAIVLANEIKADMLLIDDIAARMIARGKGINIMGTLGKINDLKGVIDELHRKGFWMSERLYKELVGD